MKGKGGMEENYPQWVVTPAEDVFPTDQKKTVPSQI